MGGGRVRGDRDRRRLKASREGRGSLGGRSGRGPPSRPVGRGAWLGEALAAGQAGGHPRGKGNARRSSPSIRCKRAFHDPLRMAPCPPGLCARTRAFPLCDPVTIAIHRRLGGVATSTGKTTIATQRRGALSSPSRAPADSQSAAPFLFPLSPLRRGPQMKKRSTRDTAKVAAPPPPGSEDSSSPHAIEVNALAASLPFNANKPLEYGDQADGPAEGETATPPSPSTTGSTLSEKDGTEKSGEAVEPGTSAMEGTLERVRVDSGGRGLTTNQGVAVADNQNSLKAGLRGPDAARRLHPAREDHALRPRAHSRAHRACPRLGRARLLRVLQAADRS